MKDLVSHSPVVLDPNTAHTDLAVSDDLRSVQYKETAVFIDNPDRVDGNLIVVGSEGFSSGVHSWQVDIEGEVDVEDEAGWAVGVVNANAPRGKSITSGSWEIRLKNGKYTAYAPPSLDKVLSFPTMKQPLHRIKVDLDWDGGKLIFSDPKTDKNIYTFRHSFTKKLYPFFSTSAAHKMKIVPSNISPNDITSLTTVNLKVGGTVVELYKHSTSTVPSLSEVQEQGNRARKRFKHQHKVFNMDFNCPVCLEVYKDPVVLSCSHSFCKACLQDWWREKVTQECPICKRRSSRSDPPCNLVLKNLCEAFSQQLTVGQVQPTALCPQHKEKLQLFCLDHQQPVCLVCRDSRAHHKHRFSPIDEVTQDYKEKLRQSLEPLKNRLKMCNDVKQQWIQTTEHIKEQGQRTEKRIHGEFDKIRVFLQKEEQARIRALKTEVQQKSSLMEQRVVALTQEIAALSESIRQTEAELKVQDVTFLQNYSSAVRRVLQVPLKSVPQLPSDSLVNVAKHLGNLGFNIWSQMKDLVSYSPVVLDPNTANGTLIVSDDLSSVHCAYTGTDEDPELPFVPHNPERFSYYTTVLGAEGFTSGQHCWEVDVQKEGRWAVGVITKSAPRRGDITSGYWEIWFKGDHYTAYAPPNIDKVLTLMRPPQRVRVDLDMNRGKLSFSDAQTKCRNKETARESQTST
ncbi:hypothetical protein WMY93_014931 [Mugilogobius chulae]|uniref:Uncharacterized protein n=1 Tax=Mugilogobius chulae TaxID=88201 RepID=A0AAW0NWD6_9GOBI